MYLQDDVHFFITVSSCSKKTLSYCRKNKLTCFWSDKPTLPLSSPTPTPPHPPKKKDIFSYYCLERSFVALFSSLQHLPWTLPFYYGLIERGGNKKRENSPDWRGLCYSVTTRVPCHFLLCQAQPQTISRGPRLSLVFLFFVLTKRSHAYPHARDTSGAEHMGWRRRPRRDTLSLPLLRTTIAPAPSSRASVRRSLDQTVRTQRRWWARWACRPAAHVPNSEKKRKGKAEGVIRDAAASAG